MLVRVLLPTSFKMTFPLKHLLLCSKDVLPNVNMLMPKCDVHK